MIRKYTGRIVGTAVAMLPLFALAQTGPSETFGPIGTVIERTLTFFNSTIVPLIFAASFVFFLYGMFKYFFLSGADEEGRTQGKQLALWAVIAFVIMVSLWGLVNVIAAGLGFAGSDPPALPTVPTTGGGGTGGNGYNGSGLPPGAST